MSRDPASVTEVAEPLRITRSAVLQRLRVLERAALVTSRKSGRERIRRLDMQGMNAAQSWLAERCELWERRLDRLGDQLVEQDGKGRET